MIPIAKFIFFVLTCIIFGFVSLNKLAKITSLVFLIPFSVSFGFSTYIFTCHILSYCIGPQLASFSALILLLSLTIFIGIFKKLPCFKIESGIYNYQFLKTYRHPRS